MFDYLIVGAGLAGSALAERLAAVEGKKVLIINKRNHTAGNAYDFYDDAGILIHKYGPHIYHTNSADVFNYLAKFTKCRNYQYKVLAHTDGQYVLIPINLNTINSLYGMNLNPSEVNDFFFSVKEDVTQVKTSKDVLVKAISRELSEMFFKGHPKKQWDFNPSELDESVASRVLTRTNKDDTYFTNTYQAMPLHGFTKMFEKMLSHPNIKIMLNTDYHEIMDEINFKKMIFTGPVDEYFDFCYRKLPYRSIDFKFETLDQKTSQRTGTISYPNDYDFTRITEFKYLTGQKHKKTTIVYEFHKSDGDPCYPIPRPENNELYKKYQQLALQSDTIL